MKAAASMKLQQMHVFLHNNVGRENPWSVTLIPCFCGRYCKIISTVLSKQELKI